MNVDINIIYFLSLLILIPIVSYGVSIISNHFKDLFNDNYLNLINVICYRRYINFNKILVVSDYESYHKYEIWKLYNQY
jgi:hypothetical protein